MKKWSEMNRQELSESLEKLMCEAWPLRREPHIQARMKAIKDEESRAIARLRAETPEITDYEIKRALALPPKDWWEGDEYWEYRFAWYGTSSHERL